MIFFLFDFHVRKSLEDHNVLNILSYMDIYLIYFVYTHDDKSRFYFQSTAASLIQQIVNIPWEVGSFYPVFDWSGGMTDIH